MKQERGKRVQIRIKAKLREAASVHMKMFEQTLNVVKLFLMPTGSIRHLTLHRV